MSRAWLRPFAAGAAVVSIAAVGGRLYASYHKKADLIVLQYVKPVGLHQTQQPPDPAPQFENASGYAVFVAKKCGLQSWKLETNGVAHDADDIVRLEVRLAGLSDQSFNCLGTFVQPPLVTIERKSS
ncbi:MAG: hypothetical protein KF730_08730 [Sphingomonas sp.]|uniref:hypothetical protein n=1 Tax=Sphingomonas sp. TaxID=28214 RepID=UPI0025D81A8C|nr:hypothetical protein [Sphingomonas sp.]MBX3564645.1 hypothetical protein [Sphingomonas sp.]